MQEDRITFEPPAEVLDYDKEVVIVVNTRQTEELPQVKLEEDKVIISYKRKAVYEREVHEVTVTRTIHLPPDKYELADLDFRNGVLTVKLRRL
ncbi:MAG: hypothetical protein GXO42_01925 [bacterium]|nr:hypothetical protein [bacterium]